MEEKLAKKKQKAELVGKGCLIQGLGLLAPFIGAIFGPIGIMIGIAVLVIFFIVGSTQSLSWTCNNCGTKLLDKTVQECPSCHARFTK